MGNTLLSRWARWATQSIVARGNHDGDTSSSPRGCCDMFDEPMPVRERVGE